MILHQLAAMKHLTGLYWEFKLSTKYKFDFINHKETVAN
jgi:hypothetical protein